MEINIKLSKSKIEEWVFSLVSFLRKDQDFEKLVLELRNKLGVPQKGLEVVNWIEDFSNRFLDWSNGEKKEKFRILSVGVNKILNSYLLPSWWNYQLKVFVVYNVMLLDDTLIEVEPSGNHTVKIRFAESVSQSEFIKWVKDNWQIFKWAYPESRRSWRPRIKQDMIAIYEKIIQLKDNQSYSFSGIAEELSKELQDKFGKNYDSEAKINEESVKQMYHRYKNYLQKFTIKK